MLLGNELGELLALDRAPAVSMYLPTHLPGQDIRHQDPIRLRNLLNGAGKRLAAESRGPEAQTLFAFNSLILNWLSDVDSNHD